MDTSVLINFLHLDRLDLLGALAGYEFVITEEVEEEVLEPRQVSRLRRALEAGHIDRARLLEPSVQQLYSELHESLDRGEASSLALAVHEDGLIACDERGAFRREASARLGLSRLFTTPGLLLVAIRQGHLSVHEADVAKRRLERRRFRMSFASFGDLLE